MEVVLTIIGLFVAWKIFTWIAGLAVVIVGGLVIVISAVVTDMKEKWEMRKAERIHRLGLELRAKLPTYKVSNDPPN